MQEQLAENKQRSMNTLGCGDTQAALGFFVDPAVPVVLVGTVAIRHNDQNCAQGIRSGDPNMLLLCVRTREKLDNVTKIRVAKRHRRRGLHWDPGRRPRYDPG